jgi:outer membrane immunogenic protein
MQMPPVTFIEQNCWNQCGDIAFNACWIAKGRAGMRRVFISTISLLTLTAGSAFAADIPARAPVKAPVYVPAFSWTGPYIGIVGGYGWGSADWFGFSGDADPDGGLIGLTLGYNWQAPGSPWVFGLEGDIAWANLHGSFTNATCPTGCEVRTDWIGTLRGRVGYAFDRIMPYLTGGLAVTDLEATVNGVGSASSTEVGWTIGAGVEAALAPNWTAKIEYLYVDLGSTSCGAAVCGIATNVDASANLLRLGVNFKF